MTYQDGLIDSAALAARFRAFDEAARKDAQSAPPATREAAHRRLRVLIDKLPQREAIKKEHILPWIERSWAMAEERMEIEGGEVSNARIHEHVFWHLRRASGIGGSEAGTVLKHYRGEPGTFGNAHNLVLEKLLVLSPKPGTPEMARGVRAEPWLQRMYLAQSGAEIDKAGLDRLKGMRWEKRPAMIGTPDDLVMIPDHGRRLIDYKAPSADVCEDYEKNGISMDYVCQVHHYGILSMAAGIVFQDMEIQVFDPRFFLMTAYPVPFDREIAKEMVQTQHRIWCEHVMTGSAPDAPRPDELDVEDPALRRIAVEAAMLKVIEDSVSAERKDMLSRISLMGSQWHDKATGTMTLPVATFARQRKWDEDKLTDLAVAAGIDPDAFRTTNKKAIDTGQASAMLHEIFKGGDEDPAQLLAAIREIGMPYQRPLDCEALANHLEEQGIDVSAAAGVAEKFSLTRKKKGPEAERLALLKDRVSELVESINEVVQETAPGIILGQDDEETPSPSD